MSFRKLIVALFAIAILFPPMLFADDERDQVAGDEAASEQIVAAVGEAWAHNRSRFENMICQFELTRWVTDSIESAINGVQNPARGFAACEWRKRGDHQLLIVNADPARNPETLIEGADGFTYGFRAYRSKTYLLDGLLWMAIANGYGSIHMSGGDSLSALTPFSLTSTPLSSVNDNSPASPKTFLRPRESDPPGIVRIEVAGSDDNRCELAFDVGDDVKLTQARYSNRAELLRIDVLGYRKCPNGACFPVRIRRIITSTENPGEIIVDECTVTDLQTEVSVEESDLAVEFEAGSAINAPTLGNMAMTKIVTPRRVSPADLRSLVEECEATEARFQNGSIRKPTIPPTPPSRWLPLSLGAAFAVVLFAVLLRHRALHQQQPDSPRGSDLMDR